MRSGQRAPSRYTWSTPGCQGVGRELAHVLPGGAGSSPRTQADVTAETRHSTTALDSCSEGQTWPQTHLWLVPTTLAKHIFCLFVRSFIDRCLGPLCSGAIAVCHSVHFTAVSSRTLEIPVVLPVATWRGSAVTRSDSNPSAHDRPLTHALRDHLNVRRRPLNETAGARAYQDMNIDIT